MVIDLICHRDIQCDRNVNIDGKIYNGNGSVVNAAFEDIEI